MMKLLLFLFALVVFASAQPDIADELKQIASLLSSVQTAQTSAGPADPVDDAAGDSNEAVGSAATALAPVDDETEVSDDAATDPDEVAVEDDSDRDEKQAQSQSQRALTSGSNCATTWVVLLSLTIFFAGSTVTLATAAVMLYRASHMPAEGYKSLDREGMPHDSLTSGQKAALVTLAAITLAATLIVGIYFGVTMPSTKTPVGAPQSGAASRLVTNSASGFHTAVVSGHNTRRQSLNKGIPNLAWNAADADVAINYIKRCPGLVHNVNRGKRGENIYVSSQAGVDPSAAIKAAMTAWWAEKANYQYSTNKCLKGMCGHYTQMAWKTTKGIGCAVNNQCGGTWKTQVVCNYSPPGNYIGQRPY